MFQSPGRRHQTFLLQAQDDDVDNVNHSLVHYIALKNAGVPVEIICVRKVRTPLGCVAWNIRSRNGLSSCRHGCGRSA